MSKRVNDRDHAVLKAEWDSAFAALRAAGLDSDADDPIAIRYRAASNAVNHANRSRDFTSSAYVLLIEAPDQDATLHTWGDEVNEVRFDHYYFSKYADASETLEYLGHCLTELAGSAGLWPTELWDEYVGLVKAGIASVNWEIAPDIGWEHLEWKNPEATKR